MYRYKLKITKIYDGDTLYGDVDLGFNIWTFKKFRLIGINTPEIRTRDLLEKAKGLKVRDWVKERVENASEIQIESLKKGKYGRWLGVLYLDGVNINEELLSLGLAKPY